MKRYMLLFCVLSLLCSAQSAPAAVKTLTSDGQKKLDDWAVNLTKAYSTALKKVLSKTREATDIIPVFAKDSSGFTISGYVKVWSNNVYINMPANTGCNLASQNQVDTTAQPYPSLPLFETTRQKVSGAYGRGNTTYCKLTPNTTLVDKMYGTYIGNFGEHLENPTLNSSCLVGTKEVEYSLLQPLFGGEIAPPFTGTIFALNVDPTNCFASASRSQPFAQTAAFSCDVRAKMADVRSVLQQYRGYLASCNTDLVPPERNADLIAVDKMLAELDNGVELAVADVTAGDNPATAQNPWTEQKPKLEAAGLITQTYLVENQLLQNLKVKVTRPDNKATQIGFSVTSAPGADWKFDAADAGQSVTLLTTNGLVETGFKLGTLPGPYSIKAACAECCPTEIPLEAVAKTVQQVTELFVVQCDNYAAKGAAVKNAFIVRAFNTLTHKGVESFIVNFEAEVALPAGAQGQKAFPPSTFTNTQGIAFGSLITGDKTGGYVYRAVCPSCLANPEVHCTVQAVLPPKVAVVPSDEGPEVGDPSVTPMLRISNIDYPNDDVSFTTTFGENNIKLAADLKPDTLVGISKDISWVVEDFPTDNVDSGDPVDPANGPATGFYVNHPYVPAASAGRPGPLKYKIQASVMTDKGRVKSYPRHILQDDIDKCRQEYMDFEAKLSDAPRAAFSPGTDGDFGKYWDCYANIYPSVAAAKAIALQKSGYKLTITSGYRSPRYNIIKKKSSVNSTHIFGEAVDIIPNSTLPSAWKEIWDAPSATCPKVLEFDSKHPILYCGSDGNIKRGSAFPAGVKEINDIRVFSINKNCIHFGELSH